MRAVTLALGVALVGPGLWQIGAAPRADDAARAIVVKALERATWYEAQHFETRYRSLMTREVRRFDGDGEIEEEGFGDFEVIPIDGAPYERRLTLDGRPLSEQEQVWEQEREAEFREELRRAREAPADEADDEEEDDDIVFNEALIARFVFALEPEESLRHRSSFVVSFRPRPGKLPVRRRIDHALNKARGRVWIDRETYEAARVEFELIDKVRLWWGVVGTIARARGSLDRGPVVEDMWARLQLESYTDVRVLFSRTRRAEVRRWSDFELIGR